MKGTNEIGGRIEREREGGVRVGVGEGGGGGGRKRYNIQIFIFQGNKICQHSDVCFVLHPALAENRDNCNLIICK